jgi:hypothetical protein
MQPDGTLTHAEWLADGPGDTREEIGVALIEACRNVERIIAYNAGFESRCLRHLADALPRLARDLNDIESRLVDLLPVVRNHVYHPEFYGSFGLKQVFPALTGESSYETLEVAGGELASWLIQALLLEPSRFSPEERTRVRGELLAYCRTDTEALAKLLNKLKEMALTSANPVANLGRGSAVSFCWTRQRGKKRANFLGCLWRRLAYCIIINFQVMLGALSTNIGTQFKLRL